MPPSLCLSRLHRVKWPVLLLSLLRVFYFPLDRTSDRIGVFTVSVAFLFSLPLGILISLLLFLPDLAAIKHGFP